MMLFLMIGMHFLCDYPLQGDFIGKFKNRNFPGRMNPPNIPWWHLMTAHAFIHGLGVVIVTSSLTAGLVEVIAHFIIDCLKCEGYTDINIDQALHIMFKIFYFYFLY